MPKIRWSKHLSLGRASEIYDSITPVRRGKIKLVGPLLNERKAEELATQWLNTHGKHRPRGNPKKWKLKAWQRERRIKLLQRRTSWELRLEGWLRREKIRFVPQAAISHYFVDILIPNRRLCIELDGQHHLEPEQKAKDAKRQAEIEALGYAVLRFENSTIQESNRHKVLARIGVR